MATSTYATVTTLSWEPFSDARTMEWTYVWGAVAGRPRIGVGDTRAPWWTASVSRESYRGGIDQGVFLGAMAVRYATKAGV